MSAIILPDTHISLTSSDDIDIICAPLKKIGITSFNYIKTFHSGPQINLCNNADWLAYFYGHSLFEGAPFELHPASYQSGFSLWANFSHRQVFVDAREFFDIANGITMIEQGLDACEFFYFASTRYNSKIINFYINNIDLLKRFILFFKEKAEPIITTAKSQLITIPGDVHYENKKNIGLLDGMGSEAVASFLADIELNEYRLLGKQGEVKLTNIEYTIAMALLEGKTAEETGLDMCRSRRTIETHLINMRRKLGCSTKSELTQVLMSNDLLPMLPKKMN